MVSKNQCNQENILTVISTAFGSVTCAIVIWLHILELKIAIDLKLYSSVSMNVMCTVVAVTITAKLQWNT